MDDFRYFGFLSTAERSRRNLMWWNEKCNGQPEVEMIKNKAKLKAEKSSWGLATIL